MKNQNKEEYCYLNPEQPVELRVKDLLSRMTLEEKISQLGSAWVYELLSGLEFSEEKAAGLLKHGIGQITRIGGASSLGPEAGAKIANAIQKYLIENTRLGIPAMVHEESCSGYMAKDATCFPQTIGVSCSWDPETVEDMAAIIKEQMRTVGAHQALAPLLDVTRDPRWGRVEETYGEDPYLVSAMGTSFVKGLQGNDWKEGIIATGKHFVGYGNSEGGMNWAPAHIPERELHEVFLQTFEAAVKEGRLHSIMNAYHELDGIPCASSKELLTGILREQWGFDGIVVSDYFAVNMLYDYHRVARNKPEAAKMALEAGIDVELPSMDCYSEPLKQGIENGSVDLALLDKTVERVLTMKFKLGLFENPYIKVDKVTEAFDTPSQREVALKLARESIVLLKNEGNILPLDKNIGSIAVIGPNADNIRNMIGDYTYPSHIESLIEMRDSSNFFNTPVPEKVELTENFVSIISMLQGIREKLKSGTRLSYAKGCDVLDRSNDGFEEAVKIARESDISLVFVGDRAGLTPECTVGESRDRAEINLPGVQEELVKAVYETGKPIIVVLVNGRPFSINWIAENIPAIVEAWLPGEEGARAVADVLFGDYNPGGKLSISFPRTSGQIPVYYSHKLSGGRSHWRGDYVETSSKPLFPFGYGLSYTNFEYSGLEISPQSVETGGNVEISFDVENTGGCSGDEVVQLYINDEEASVTRPVKELKGFRRIRLEAGEKKNITFILSTRQLGFYDRNMNFVVEPGHIQLMVGSSSDDIRLSGKFEITGKTMEISRTKEFFTRVYIK